MRTTLLTLLAAAYAVYDPSETLPDRCGPADAAPVRSGETVLFSMATGLSEQSWPSPAGALEVRIEHPRADIGQGGRPHSSTSKELIGYPIQFHSENLDSPEVTAFRQQAQALLDAATDAFALCNEVRKLTRHGDELPQEQLAEPEAILASARSGKHLTCRPFALLLVELCVLKGYTARLLGLTFEGTAFDHAVAEVYLPEQSQWVVLDPDFNIAYRRESRWLSAAEVHDNWIRLFQQISRKIGSNDPTVVFDSIQSHPEVVQQLTGMEAVALGEAGDRLRRTNLRNHVTGMGLRFYEHVYYPIRNDFLTSDYPTGHPIRVQQHLLVEDVTKPVPGICPEAVPVTDRSLIYWPVGRTHVELRPTSSPGTPETVNFELATFTPNFSHFEVTRGDGTLERHTKSHYRLAIPTDPQTITIRAVNIANLRGEPTTVHIARTPPSR